MAHPDFVLVVFLVICLAFGMFAKDPTTRVLSVILAVAGTLLLIYYNNPTIFGS